MAIIKKYKTVIVKIESTFQNVYTVYFKSLTGSFKYDPGQFLHLAIDQYDASAQWPDSRCFSIQSAPGSELLKITYIVKGTFTQKMKSSLEIGKEITLKLPYGDLFTKPHDKTNTIFIAGGTGITPFLSLFTHKLFAAYDSPKLYAGFKNENFNLYNQELEVAKSINPSFSISIWNENVEGILNIKQIYCDNGSKKTYFISGPPSMIHSFKTYLLAQGLEDAFIRTDDWE